MVSAGSMCTLESPTVGAVNRSQKQGARDGELHVTSTTCFRSAISTSREPLYAVEEKPEPTLQ